MVNPGITPTNIPEELRHPHPERMVLAGGRPLSELEIKNYETSYANGLKAANYLLGVQSYDSQMEIERLDYEATRNPVSGQLNERGFYQSFAEAQKDFPAARFALIAIDLASFKAVNDELGHQEGDRLLREVGAALRQTDITAIVSNPHGDEFIVCTPIIDGEELRDDTTEAFTEKDRREESQLSDEERVEAIISRLEAVAENLIQDNPVLARLSFGISAGGVILEPDADIETVKRKLVEADEKMYLKKQANLLPLNPEQQSHLDAIRHHLAALGMSARDAQKYLA